MMKLLSGLLMFGMFPCFVFGQERPTVRMHYINGQWVLPPIPGVHSYTETEAYYKDHFKICSYEDDYKACLDEINARRRQQGMRPYIFDQVLAEKARTCALWRAANLCEGHIPGSDFRYSGTWPPIVKYTGCAAWSPRDGFGSCAMYETDCTHCGAARILGRDGKMYCHLFVR